MYQQRLCSTNNQCFGSGFAKKKCLLDLGPNPHGEMQIRIWEVKMPNKNPLV